MSKIDETVGYVIRVTNDKDEIQYLCYDRDAMMYCLVSSLTSAKIFTVLADAEKLFGTCYFTEESRYSDGSIRPPYYIDKAIGLNDTKRKGSCIFSIVPLELKLNCAMEKVNTVGEIKTPKGFIY